MKSLQKWANERHKWFNASKIVLLAFNINESLTSYMHHKAPVWLDNQEIWSVHSIIRWKWLCRQIDISNYSTNEVLLSNDRFYLTDDFNTYTLIVNNSQPDRFNWWSGDTIMTPNLKQTSWELTATISHLPNIDNSRDQCCRGVIGKLFDYYSCSAWRWSDD